MEQSYNVRPVIVEYVCDECHHGKMLPTGSALLCYPVRYPHQCNECGAVKNFEDQYPTLRYVPLGEMNK